MIEQVRAPFTDDQVESLNNFQAARLMHPFTCGVCREPLFATVAGWVCPTFQCPYTQAWAHGFMANWTWKGLGRILRKP